MRKRRITAWLCAMVLCLCLCTPVLSEGETATISVEVELHQSDARGMLSSLNSFREGGGTYKDSSGEEITVDPGELSGLSLDADLEQAAIRRAAQMAYGGGGSGSGVNTYSGSSLPVGSFESDSIASRNLLNEDYNSVGIACVKVGDSTYWAMVFGDKTATAPSEAVNGTRTVSVTVGETWLEDKTWSLTASPSSLDLEKGESGTITSLSLSVTDKDGKTYSAGSVSAESCSWWSGDESIATVNSDGTVYGVGKGSTSIGISYDGKATAYVSVSVTSNEIASLVNPDPVTLPAGTDPSPYFPSTVTAVWDDGSYTSVAVYWGSVPAEIYQNPDGGEADVSGTVDGFAGTATIHFVFEKAEPISYTVLDNGSQEAEQGQMLGGIQVDGDASKLQSVLVDGAELTYGTDYTVSGEGTTILFTESYVQSLAVKDGYSVEIRFTDGSAYASFSVKEVSSSESESGDEPGSSSSDEPGSSSSDEPGSSSSDEPGSGSGEEPGSGSGEEPGSGSGDEPSGEEPGSGSGDDPSEPSGDDPSEPSGSDPIEPTQPEEPSQPEQSTPSESDEVPPSSSTDDTTAPLLPPPPASSDQTTEAPTTAAPTTAAPTTAAPTTAAPTTAAPTAAPTTAAPTAPPPTAAPTQPYTTPAPAQTYPVATTARQEAPSVRVLEPETTLPAETTAPESAPQETTESQQAVVPPAADNNDDEIGGLEFLRSVLIFLLGFALLGGLGTGAVLLWKRYQRIQRRRRRRNRRRRYYD